MTPGFEKLEVFDGTRDDGLRGLRVEGYYRRSQPQPGGRCIVLDPRELAKVCEARIVARCQGAIQVAEEMAKAEKIDQETLNKHLLAKARAAALLASPKKIKQMALAEARQQKHEEARLDAMRRLSAVIDEHTRDWKGRGEASLELSTNSRTGYHAFRLEIHEERGDE